VEGDPHGAGGRSDDVRDLVGPHAGDAAQEDDLPLARRQSLDGALELDTQLGGLRRVLRALRS